MIILLLLLPNGIKREYSFEADSSIKIGSDPICDVVIPSDIVDKVHCTLILYYDDVFYYLLFDGEIQGSSSTGGTWVNNKRVFPRCRINNQDVVTFSEDYIYPHLVLFPDGMLTECKNNEG
jgi:pSer/pThr/pTyr-binding forkhead associated (FHA) protein